MRNAQLIERHSIKKKHVTAIIFIGLAIFLDYICLNALYEKFLDLLINKYKMSPTKAQNIKSSLYSFFLIVSGIGGIFSDILLDRILLVIFCYISAFFGIMGLLLLDLNSSHGFPNPNIPVLCNFKTETFPSNCKFFLYFIVTLIGCGTGFIKVILFVIGTDQVRCYGVRSVSICIFALYGVGQFGSFLVGVQSVVENRANKWKQFIYYLLSIIGCLFISFIFFIVGRLHAEFRRQKRFVKEYFKAFIELFRSCRMGESLRNLIYNTKIRVHLESGDLDDSLDGIKRLGHFFLIWCLIIPCYTVLSQLALNDSQIKLFHLSTEAAPFRGGLANSCGVLIAILLFICLSLKYLHRGEVFSYKWRLILGTALGILAAIYSGVLESVRLEMFWNKNETVFNNNNQTVANLSVYNMLPPNILAAFSEVFLCVTTLEYAYLSMPPNLQSSAMGLVWSSWGMGSIFASEFYKGFDGVLYDKGNPNELDNSNGHLDYFYYILSLLSLVLFVLLMTIYLKFLPSIFDPYYMGMEERLLGDNVDELEEEYEEGSDADDDYDDDELYRFNHLQVSSPRSSPVPGLV